MTPEQIQGLEPAFAVDLQRFADCCGCPATFRLLQIYCRGLLSDLPRKTAMPLALASGTAVRTLQDHVWYRSLAQDSLTEHVAGLLPAPMTVPRPPNTGNPTGSVEAWRRAAYEVRPGPSAAPRRPGGPAS